MKKTVFFTITLILAITLCSCAMNTKGTDDPIDSLKTSINTLWKARMEKKWGTVYDLTDRVYQKQISREKFASQGEMHVLEYKISQIIPDPVAPGKCEVLIDFTINKMGYVFKPVVKELWILENKQWVLNKSLMLNTKPL